MKKAITLLLALLMVGAFTFALVGCDNDSGNNETGDGNMSADLVGTWDLYIEGVGVAMEGALVINADGTLESMEIPMEWTYADGEMTISFAGTETDTWTVSLDGDILTIGAVGEVLTYRRA
ncbi:MAG: hypothetical protein FWE06_02635 [Oscillospiraceae bacterium]|nr:hypothetical protein [Oscillospiraceae bacterium]